MIAEGRNRVSLVQRDPKGAKFKVLPVQSVQRGGTYADMFHFSVLLRNEWGLCCIFNVSSILRRNTISHNAPFHLLFFASSSCLVFSCFSCLFFYLLSFFAFFSFHFISFLFISFLFFSFSSFFSLFLVSN